LERILTDDSLASSLGAAGHRRAAGFTWSACTAAHVAAYEAALGRASHPNLGATGGAGGPCRASDATGGAEDMPGSPQEQAGNGGPGDPS
jgi:hypothetical protein